jgi:phosphonate transport system ATP-binding protein
LSGAGASVGAAGGGAPVGAPAVALELRSLQKSYVRGKPVLHAIDLSIAGTGLTAIIGPSGTGKSTLIRCVNRLVEPSGGQVLLDGEDLTALRGRSLRLARRRIGMVFQEYNLVERLSVMENLLTGVLGHTPAWRAWLRRFAPEDIDRAWQTLGLVGLQDFVNARADSLSGGQRQRVGIARAVMQSPALLLADEPTSSLDPKTSADIMDLLKQVGQQRSIPVIVNMHDVALAKRCADRIVGMHQGQVVFDGPAQQLSDTDLHTIYGGRSWLD